MAKASTNPIRSQRIGMLTTGAIIFFALGFFSSWLWGRYADSSGQVGTVKNSVPIRLGMVGLIDPLLEYTTGIDNSSELVSLNAALQAEVDSEIKNNAAMDIGIFYQDLTSGRWGGVNSDEKFSPASLLKVPTMITYLKLAETKPSILARNVLYNGSTDSNAIEDIRPLKSIQAGHFYTVDELLKFMIDYSDNNAVDLLYTHDLQNAFNQTYIDIGLPVPTSTDDFLSPRQYSRFFRILYNATYLDQASSQKALDLLLYADFPQGLMAGVPDQMAVAQKFGEHQFGNGVDELHDCGIVYYPARPYVVCIMTKGSDFQKLTKAISDISQLIYQEVDSGQWSR